MKGLWRIGAMGCVLACVATARGAEPATVKWHSDVNSAWQTAQLEGRPLLIFVTRDNCYYCTQMKERTLASSQVTTAIQRSFVPLVLDGGGNSPLLKELNVTGYPCTFVVSPQAVIVERIEGYVPPDALARRLQPLVAQRPVVRFAKDP